MGGIKMSNLKQEIFEKVEQYFKEKGVATTGNITVGFH